ncbi:class I SAM-dependent methyltransferase [Rhodohalobacter sp. 8-1]|uniref:class I SAM-dependent methyltransferase n=1 Tax=Rhodohalobacter sp. 8-1 TaxID=3131972 RepID=UPI0030EB23FC
MPHQPNYKDFSRLIRQLREALELTRSTNFRFLSFAPPGHFYSPIPDYIDIKSGSYTRFDAGLKEIPGLELNEDCQLDLIERFSKFKSEIPWPAESRNPDLRYHFDNIYFIYGDAVALFGMMREFQPKRMIEVGSGYSSAAMIDIDTLFLNQSTEFTFIEPHAERLNNLMSKDDADRFNIIEKPVQQVPLSLFESLRQNDILFIDSSHVSKTGSDVNHLIHRILPALKSGVIIHFHDIFWPFDYPKKWLKAGRAWNEAYLLLAFLQYNSGFEILFFNSWLEQHHRDFLKQKIPLMLHQPESPMTFGNSSLWLRKK